MMIKKITTFAIGLLLTAGLWAQSGNNEMFGHAAKGGAKSITFSASDIEFWTGTGTNQAIYVLAWDDDPYNNDTALAWGVRWNGSATATSLLDTIVAYDSRFSYTLSGSLMTDMSFNDGTINPGSSMNGWCYYHNGSWGMYAWPNQPMNNGDMIEMSSSCMFTMTSATAVSNPYNTDPVDATIDTNDIVFWVGSGSNSAVLIVNWGDPDTAFAWGYRFNGSVTAQTMVDSIAAADPRFWTVGSPSLSGDIHYILTNGDTLGLVDGSSTSMGYNFWWTNINGVSAGSGTATTLHNGDVFKYGDLSVGTGWDPMGTYFMEYAWEKTPTPAPLPTDDPETPEDATIDTSDIAYWVGSGSNKLTFVVNWADTALAWGYRFSEDSVTLSTVMNNIAMADPRFSYSGEGMISDINYVENGDTLGITPGNYWSHYLNGTTSAGMMQWMHNGDFSRWADPASGVLVDSVYHEDWGGWWELIYAYPQTIYPVSEPTMVSDTITADEIEYWIGEGENEAIFVVNWADTALAWGYRFSEDSINMRTVMNHIDLADYRLVIVYPSPNEEMKPTPFNIRYHDAGCSLSGSQWDFIINGHATAPYSDEIPINNKMGSYVEIGNGDFIRFYVQEAAVFTDSIIFHNDPSQWEEYVYVFPQEITPVSPINATIDNSDIEYWIGEGENKVAFVVNWADTALAWGYRFANDSVTLATMMDDIAAADSRFSYSGEGMVSDINFIENGDTLGITPGNWWEHSINGISSMGMGQWFHNGDMSRWADPAAGVAVDSFYYEGWGWIYTYVYPRMIHPVSDPNAEGPFCGIVGTEGCTAIALDDARIKGWATGCTVVRGSSNLSDPNAADVSYGEESAGVGPASTSTLEAVSLGDGGMATLTFGTPIANGDGFDFAVFENSFDDYFLELAVVEVSSDGEHFVRFPATSLTQTRTQIGGRGRVDATFINNLAGKYRVGYGTPFDLEELRDSTNIDINNITHVRLIDVVGSIDPQYGTYDAFGHIINDPFPTISHSAGFDLEGVCVLNQQLGINDAEATTLNLFPNPARNVVSLTLKAEAAGTVAIYDMTGRQMLTLPVQAGNSTIRINTADMPNGVYMVSFGNHVEKLVVRH